ncbi:hypothetical protein IscW_ISCW021735 [Ixodes scapularis]|uniref:Uncharacterized protein n=1 Tax=Ixodes scapularis TaxID=6945 RepID=B7Q7V2_IXOSC|nr:hypothetical protein IscW_ISCW021735 [Ixodes scapularis]|eukprot:XP_002412217.1 hypothetical protein IscW_ISCW021735 [Ixodes scapularis]
MMIRNPASTGAHLCDAVWTRVDEFADCVDGVGTRKSVAVEVRRCRPCDDLGGRAGIL